MTELNGGSTMTEKSDGKLFFPGEEWRNEI